MRRCPHMNVSSENNRWDSWFVISAGSQQIVWQKVSLSGAITKEQHACVYVRPFAWNESAHTGQIFVKFYAEWFLLISAAKFHVRIKLDQK